MLRTFLCLIILAALGGCDAPQRTRTPNNFVNNGALGDTSGQLPTTGTVNGGNSGGTTTNPPTNTPGFESCDLSNRYHTVDIGFFGLCQNTQDETLFRFKPSLTSTEIQICLIPTYKEGNGSSTYIGQPQCTFTQQNQVIQGKLYKNRQGFGSYPLNGVIVMRQPLLPEYFACMHGYTNWPANACPQGPTTNPYCLQIIQNCPSGGRTSPACDLEARNYMAQVCNNFKNRYSNSYLDIRTR